MSLIINILLSIVVGGMIAFLTYLLLLKIKGYGMGTVHFILLGLMILFVGVQSFLFFTAMDIKSALVGTAEDINAIASASSEMISQFDGSEEISDNFSDAISTIDINPILRLFGFSLGDGGIEVSQDRIDSINSYMIHRCIWVFVAVLVYIVVALMLPSAQTSRRSTSRRYGSNGHRDSGYVRRSGPRGRRHSR